MAWKPYGKPGPKKKKAPKEIKRTPIKYKPKGDVYGQKEMFLEIWEERDHVSELSGEWLGEDPNVWFFAHILPKGRYKAWKLEKFNIMLLTPDEHCMVDTLTHKAKEDRMYDKFFQKQQEFKILYHKTNK